MKVLVLDCNYICHAVFHSMPPLFTSQQYTQVIFGFIKKLIAYSQQFPSNDIVFAWDSKYSIRKEIYPEYKKQRADKLKDATEAELKVKKIAYDQFDDLRESILPDLGFVNVFMQDGYEADDIMASVTKCNPDCEFIVISTDQDMFQIISDSCRLYNPTTKVLRTVESFQADWGCHPCLWGEAKSISGCSTDNVKGVSGVAEGTAIKYLLGQLSIKSKKFNDIAASKSIITENRELIKLPMYLTNHFVLNGGNTLSRQKFVKFCEKYDFKSLLSKTNLDKWDRVII